MCVDFNRVLPVRSRDLQCRSLGSFSRFTSSNFLGKLINLNPRGREQLSVEFTPSYDHASDHVIILRLLAFWFSDSSRLKDSIHGLYLSATKGECLMLLMNTPIVCTLLAGCNMDLKCWAPLSCFDQSILDKVRLAYVFGHLGGEAFVITDDDEVIACGANRSSCLGLGMNQVVVNPMGVTELRQKGVKGFSFGGISSDSAFVVAYTYSGSVYVWGKPIGVERSNTTIISTPSLISLSEKISIVSCGSNHCLALSQDGKVYSWGSNDFGQLGISGVTKSDKPVTVQDLSDKRVVKISCGTNFSVVVLDNGQVYAFGSNEHCQLGSSNKSFFRSSVPKEVNLGNVIIEDLFCGASHVLALSNVGELYVWGKNDCGELGLGDENLRLLPEMNKKIGKVMDIAASFVHSVSAAMTDEYEVHMWGDFFDHFFYAPVYTTFKSLHEVFAVSTIPKIMYKPTECQSQIESMSATVQKAFNIRETSDLTIRVEEKEIFVHRSILKLRSEYFRVFLQDYWVDKDQRVLDIDRKYDVIYPYIRYLYTGEVTIDPELVLELLNLADEYQDSAFKKQCERSFQRDITIDNVGILFSAALKSNAKSLLESCISFASRNVNEVLQAPAISEWDPETMKEFLMICGKKKLFRS